MALPPVTDFYRFHIEALLLGIFSVTKFLERTKKFTATAREPIPNHANFDLIRTIVTSSALTVAVVQEHLGDLTLIYP